MLFYTIRYSIYILDIPFNTVYIIDVEYKFMWRKED